MLSESSPILSSVTNGVGHGLAWGHFFGYLQFILTGIYRLILTLISIYQYFIHYSISDGRLLSSITDLSIRIKAADKSDWDIQDNATICTKMVAIFPNRGRQLRSLSDYDADITSVTFKSTGQVVKVKHTIDFPGHPKKDFSCGMFKATVNETVRKEQI